METNIKENPTSPAPADGPDCAESSGSALLRQVQAQHKVVAHLAKALATVMEQTAEALPIYEQKGMLDMAGRRSAEIMEMLGDLMNNMGAVDDADEWTHPIFEEAQRLWQNT